MLRFSCQLAVVAVTLGFGPTSAAVPESLRGGMVDVVQAQHHQLVRRLYADAMADAATAFPKHADKLSAFAGFMSRHSAERVELRARILAEVQALLELAARADQVAAEREVVSERLVRSASKESNVSAPTAAQTVRQDAWLAKRASVVRQMDELEELHARLDKMAAQYHSLIDSTRAGQHVAQQRADRLLADFNVALGRYQTRLSAERESQVRAVSDFEKWYDAQKLQLEQLQSRINDAHDAWRTQRAQSDAAKARANKLAEGFNAAGAEDDGLRREARVALEAYEAQMQREAIARRLLLTLQSRGEALVEQTLGERQAREAILAQARESMTALHTARATELHRRRKIAQMAIAKAQLEVEAEVGVAADGVKASEEALVGRFGMDYGGLHKAVADWLAHNDSLGLEALAMPVAPQARALLELARALSREALSFKENVLTGAERDLLANQKLQQSLTSRYQDLVRLFRRRVEALKDQQARFSALLQRQSVAREAHYQRLLRGTPQLVDWGRLLKALAATLETEYRLVVASMTPTDGADALAPERWQRGRGQLRQGASRFLRMRRYVEGDTALLVQQLAAPSAVSSSKVVLVGAHAIRSAQLTPFATAPGTIEALAANLSSQTLAAWSKKDAQAQVWRFLEGRYRFSPKLGFVAVD